MVFANGTGGVVRSVSDGSARRARTAWFLCLTQPRDAISREHQQFARAAIVSARLNAPSVAPHVIYMSDSAAHPVRPDAFTGWLAAAGVRTIAHNLSFLHRIPTKRRRRGGERVSM